MSFITEFVRNKHDGEIKEEFLLWTAYSVIAGAIGRKLWLNINDITWVHPNMYVMLVAPPGITRKSTTAKLGIDLLKQLDSMQFLSDQMTEASLVKQMEEAGATQFIEFNGLKYRNSSVYVFASEAEVLLREICGNICIMLTDLYDNGMRGWHESPTFTKKLVSKEPICIYNPCINLLACSTPSSMKNNVPAENIENGFTSRILFIYNDELPTATPAPITSNLVSSHKLDAKLLTELRRINAMFGQFKVTDCFNERYVELILAQRNQIKTYGSSIYAGFYARKHIHCLKLAMILQVDRSMDLTLDGEILDLAIKQIESTEDNIYKVFAGSGKSPNSEKIHKLWEDIRKHYGVSNPTLDSLLSRSCSYMNYKEFKDNMTSLEQMNKIKFIHAGNNRIEVLITDPRPIL